METLKELPFHEIPAQVTEWINKPTLRIVGLVAKPQILSAADLLAARATFSRTSFTQDFLCDGKWTVPDQQWSGYRLLDVLALAKPLPTAKYIRVGSGDYVVPIALAEAEHALLADTLNGQPLTAAHGAPWRLALFGGRCFTSVKWVEQLELTAEPGENTGVAIVRERNQALLAQNRAQKS